MTDPITITKEDRLSGAREALLNYQQADQDGILVITSRQAIHEVDDALTALEAERDALGIALHAAEIMAEMAETKVGSRITALEAENARLRDLLKQCADELADEIETNYVAIMDYPDMRRRYERDMTSVYAARKALNGE